MKRTIPAALLGLSLLAVAGWARRGRAEAAADRPDPMLEELRNIARVASVIMDGDDCLDIVTERAAELMFLTHPRDRWYGSDNYDVNHEVFVRNKKLLIRLSRLASFPVDCNLWMKCKKRPEKIHLVIRQVNGYSQWYSFGQMAIDPPPEMKKVLETGRPLTVAGRRSDYVSVLAPVFNSLEEVVGLVEVVSRRRAYGG